VSDLANKIIREALRRSPTAEDYRRINDMLNVLPDSIRSSPAAIFDIVMRTEFQRQLEETIKQAGWAAQQRIHEDLPKRVDEAALRALNKIRDLLPLDAADSARRMYKWAAIAMAITFVITWIPAYYLGQDKVHNDHAAAQAVVEVERNRCIDAAIGRIAVADRSRVNHGSGSLQVVSHDLRECIAKGEKRRASDG
jgi:hypothetical protein